MQYDYGITKYKVGYGENRDNIGRIIGVYSYSFTVATTNTIFYNVEISGSLKRKLLSIERNLTIGDFVYFKQLKDRLILEDFLPEYNKISKKVSATQTKEQLLATNIDNVFITIACDQHFSIGLLERYLYSFSNNKFNIHILITKSDLKEQLLSIIAIIQDIYPELSVIPISIYEPESFSQLYKRINPDTTSVFIGRSGSGKSTLINALIGENRQKVEKVSKKNSKGKHTTTSSVILPLKSSIVGYLVDTPGIKSISVWNESNSTIFSDIKHLERECKFSNCSHEKNQTGCAIQHAIRLGILDENRFKRYLSLNRELNRTKMSYVERTKRNNRIKNRQKKKKQSSNKKNRF